MTDAEYGSTPPTSAVRSTTVEFGYIHPLQAGKVIGCLYAAMSLIFAPFFLLAGLAGAFAEGQDAAPAGVILVVMAILMPILYGGMGFLFGALGAAIYNLIAGWTGGFRIDLR